jgi:CubicO group peptidase (beta-lactamase class C family)
MQRLLLALVLGLCTLTSSAQLYFPPLTGNTWQTVSPDSLGWCTNRIDSLYRLLDNNHTKAFIVLKDGKIAIEKYFGTFTQDSAWYWASAGKTITSCLVGIAQQQGLLDINDSTSKYLGKGWTVCPPEKEGLIKIRHQLTMTTGLDYLVPDWDCKDSSCLKYRADAGTQWFYHNATYLLLQDVIEKASGKTYQQFTNQNLGVKIGMPGLWYDGVFYSKPRSMARFGLMMLNNGVWNGDTIIKDRTYYNEMITPSQTLNKSYGYLWWLNGQPSYMIPGTIQTFPGPLCKPAPMDMFSGLGKNDQKLYIIPSKNMVIIRMGDLAADNSAVPIVFDTLLWNELNKLFCSNSTGINEEMKEEWSIYPNPGNDFIKISGVSDDVNYRIYSTTGTCIKSGRTEQNTVNTSSLPQGIYLIEFINKGGDVVRKRWLKD